MPIEMRVEAASHADHAAVRALVLGRRLCRAVLHTGQSGAAGRLGAIAKVGMTLPLTPARLGVFFGRCAVVGHASPRQILAACAGACLCGHKHSAEGAE